MKIEPADLKRLERALSTIPDIDAVRARYRRSGLSAERFRWDAFHAACRHDPTMARDFYRYMNDAHIDTALRLVLGSD